MSTYQAVQLNFINLAIVLTIVDQDGEIVDLSTTSNLQIFLKKPDTDRTVLTKTATLYTNGTDGKIQYLTVDGDLDIIGIWEAQVTGDDPNWIGGASVVRFKVVRNIVCQ